MLGNGLSVVAVIAVAGVAWAESPTVVPIVELEQDIYQYEPAGNGAGPMWCAGSTCLVRSGEHVFISGLETLPDVRPLNNCRWSLWRSAEDSWQLVYRNKRGRTREPSPLAVLPAGRVFLSANPTLTDAGVYSGPARPEIYEFDSRHAERPPRRTVPQWRGNPPFTEHSYRSFVADGRRGELLLLQNVGYTHAEWTFRNAVGEWSAAGKLVWPFGSEYDRPQPIRVCYPTVMLRERAVYFCGVSDIMEPNTEWRQFKKKLTGRDWDYDFRRLFFTWSDDITTGEFHPWIEIASREKTGGHIFPCDLWVDSEKRVHLLWTERALDERLRAEFFPEARQSHALNYAILGDGKILSRRSLVLAEEGGANVIASAARFHIAPGNHLFVVYYARGTNVEGGPVSENRLVALAADGTPSKPMTISLEHPLTSFFTATVRAGNQPSQYLDLLGTRAGAQRTMSYVRIRLDAKADSAQE